jgi:tetratricopeptide (TPR) repeat protein
MNNYDLPFDKLFVANKKEYNLFKKIGYPEKMLCVSGLLANDYITYEHSIDIARKIKKTLGISEDKKVILYTTSPLRHRLAIHNKDDLQFRIEVLKKIKEGTPEDKYTCIIKLHPNEDIIKEKEIISSIIPSAIVLGKDANIFDLFNIADIVINRGNSQTALDAVLMGIPTIIISCGLKTVFHDDGGAYVIDDLSLLPSIIKRVIKGEKPEDIRVKKNNYFLPPQGVAHLIANEIESLSKKNLPLSPEGWEWTIKTFLFHGLLKRALQISQKCPCKTKLIVALEKALQYELRKEYAAAAEWWEKCREINTEWFFPYYQLAHIYLAKGEYNKSINEADNAIKYHPPYHYLWHEIPMVIVQSTCYRKLGKIGKAWDAMKKSINSGITDISPELSLEIASLYQESGQSSNAFQALRRSIEILKDYPLNPIFDSECYHKAGLIYKSLKKDIEAIECFDRSIQLNPEHSWSFFEKGLLHKDRGEVSAAIECFEKVKAVEPMNIWTHVYLGLLYLKEKKYNLTFKYLSLAVVKYIRRKLRGNT